jgi:hypothetical protein
MPKRFRSANYFEEELFYRFEKKVPLESLDGDFRKLLYAMGRYAGDKWIPTGRQVRALAKVADKRGFHNIPNWIWIGQVKPPRRYKTPTIARKRWKRKGVKIPKVKKKVKWYVQHKYSANKIQKALKKRGIGIRRKTLLKIVRDVKKRPLKANTSKYTPKKYRRRKR